MQLPHPLVAFECAIYLVQLLLRTLHACLFDFHMRPTCCGCVSCMHFPCVRPMQLFYALGSQWKKGDTTRKFVVTSPDHKAEQQACKEARGVEGGGVGLEKQMKPLKEGTKPNNSYPPFFAVIPCSYCSSIPPPNNIPPNIQSGVLRSANERKKERKKGRKKERKKERKRQRESKPRKEKGKQRKQENKKERKKERYTER